MFLVNSALGDGSPIGWQTEWMLVDRSFARRGCDTVEAKANEFVTFAKLAEIHFCDSLFSFYFLSRLTPSINSAL